MYKNVSVNVAKDQLEQSVREMTAQWMNDYFQFRGGQLIQEITKETYQKLAKEINFRVINLVKEKFEREIIPQLNEELSNDVIRILEKNGVITVTNHYPQMAMMMPTEQSAMDMLKDLIKNAKTLLVNDPFFFHAPKDNSTEDYVKKLLDTLPLSSLKELTIIYQKPRRTDALDFFSSSLPKSIMVVLRKNDTIHDRVWMIDGTKAYLVGTSFGGIGKKLAFMLPLPDEDLAEFKSWIKKKLRIY